MEILAIIMLNNRSKDDIVREIRQLAPSILQTQDSSFLNNDTNLYKILKGLMGDATIDFYKIIDIFTQGLKLENSLFLDDYEKELGIPDLLFNDLSSTQKRLANIRLKENMRRVGGLYSSPNSNKIGVVDFLKLVGINIEIIDPTTLNIGFPKRFPYVFTSTGSHNKFLIYVRYLNTQTSFTVNELIQILENPANFTNAQLINIIQALVGAFSKVIFIK